MPDCFPEGSLTVHSRALSKFLIINHAHSNVVRAFHSEGTSFVTYPNKLIVRKSKADENLENGCSLVGQKDRSHQIHFPPFCILVILGLRFSKLSCCHVLSLYFSYYKF